MRGITVSFGGSIIALRDVDFHVRAGEVVALLRDNGAGKSTLIKVLSGVQRPQSGSVWFSGEQVTLSSPQHARRLGVETVYQDLALIPLMSVARNFFLGREPLRRLGPLRLLDHVGMDRLACEALAGVGIDISDPSQPVGRLSGGERQSIAIARAVHFGSRILVLDEPTIGAVHRRDTQGAGICTGGSRSRPWRRLHHPQSTPRLRGCRSYRRALPRTECRQLRGGRSRSRVCRPHRDGRKFADFGLLVLDCPKEHVCSHTPKSTTGYAPWPRLSTN